MKLKKCPFCGADGVIGTSRETFYALLSKNGNACISIECKNPDCGLRFYHHSDTKDYDTKLNEAIERWNHRAEVETSESL